MAAGSSVITAAIWSLLRAATTPSDFAAIPSAAECLIEPLSLPEHLEDWLRHHAPWDYLLVFLLGCFVGPLLNSLVLVKRLWILLLIRVSDSWLVDRRPTRKFALRG